MGQTEFKAVVVSNEINLNKISEHFGSDRKIKWEEALLLKGNQLEGILQQTENKMIYIFYFGSITFLNFQHHEIMDIVKYLKKLEVGINDTNSFKYVDD